MDKDEIRKTVEAAKASGLIQGPNDKIPNPLKDVPAVAVPGIRLMFVDVTPAVAHRWLSNNSNNRKLRSSTVLSYARDMKAGAWMPNHQGIAFDDCDTLIDGQHRLSGVVASGVTVRMLVSAGWPRSVNNGRATTMDTVDRGLGRTVADTLHLQHGMGDARFVVMALNSVVFFARAMAGDNCHGCKLSTPQVLALLDEWGPSAKFAVENKTQTIGLRAASVLGAMTIAHAVARDDAGKFYESLNTGAGLSANSPILSLRNYLTGGIVAKGESRDIIFRVLQHFWLFREGKHATKVAPAMDGPKFFSEKLARKLGAIRTMLAVNNE